jgi:DNA-binding transcriptional regulator YdaS (Cro superfamily)
MQLKEYLIKHGMTQRWFAAQLGISPRFFNFIVQGKRALPKKYWTQVIVLTKGEVTIEDLVHLKELYEKFYKSAASTAQPNVQSRNHSQLSEVSEEG